MGLKNSSIGLIASLILCITACNKVNSEFTDADVFRYNEHSNIASLDPAFAKDVSDIWAANQLFNGLVALDEELKVQPAIAASWDITNDGKTYLFKLRDDVYFHKHILFGKDSTRQVTAHDFEYSFRRLTDANLASPGGWTLQNVSSFKALDKHTFQIQLKQSFPPFLGLLSMKYCSVVPEEAVRFFGSEFRSNPIGTGPFQFKLWVENTKLVLRKNPLYFEKDTLGVALPYLEAVAITFLPDKQNEFLQFVQGNLDFLNSVDPSYKDDILTVEGRLNSNYADVIDMRKGPYLNTEYLGFNLDDQISDSHSLLIRKAINYGFDRYKMIKYLRNAIGIPASKGFIPSGLFGHGTSEGYTYNPAKAKAYVDQYKAESGDEQLEISITTNSQYLDLCEFIQRELQHIGFKVKIDVVPPSTLRQQKANGQLNIFRASWVADYPDAENYLSLFYSKNFAPNGPNYTHFKNELFDRWYEEAIRITDDKKRYVLYKKMDSLLMTHAPVVLLYYDEAVRFKRKNISGLGMNPTNLLDLKYVKKE